jgi:hypothetical protein
VRRIRGPRALASFGHGSHLVIGRALVRAAAAPGSRSRQPPATQAAIPQHSQSPEMIAVQVFVGDPYGCLPFFRNMVHSAMTRSSSLQPDRVGAPAPTRAGPRRGVTRTGARTSWCPCRPATAEPASARLAPQTPRPQWRSTCVHRFGPRNDGLWARWMHRGKSPRSPYVGRRIGELPTRTRNLDANNRRS